MKIIQKLLSKENLLARIISFLVACGLWVYVMTDQNPIVERNVEVQLQQINLPANMMVFNAPEKVVVRVRGTRTYVMENIDNHISASLNLKNITEGQQSIPVGVSVEGGDVVSVKPSEVSVYVDTVSEKTVPVTTRVVGIAADDMTVGSSVITPSEVTLRGATHRIDRVNKVVAPINVTDHRESFSAESDLVAVSDDGYDIANMKITPARVMVEAKMVTQMLSTELPIKLVLNGVLPEGILVTKTELVPASIRISAPPSLLRDLKEISTRPLGISALSGSTAAALELDIPERIIPETRTVQVRISVERQPKTDAAAD